MPVRTGPKSRRVPSGKKGWPGKPKSYSWRKANSKLVAGLKGIKSGVRAPPNSMRTSRMTSSLQLINYDVGGGVTGMKVVSEDAGTTTPFAVGSLVTSADGLTFSLGGAMKFTMTDLPSYTDYTALFDQYRIDQVDIEIDSLVNSAQSQATTTGNQEAMPSVTYVPDFDDANVPTTPGEINQYQRAKTWTFRGSGKPLKFSIKPRVSVPVNSVGGGANMPGAESPQLDIAHADVLHYGCKFWFNNLTSYTTAGVITPNQTNLRIKCKYFLTLINSR